jgi:hypothetical protein
MRVLIGATIGALIAVVGLVGSIAQSVVIAHGANSSTVARIAEDKTGAVVAAREGGPAVYGWLYVPPDQ